MRTMVMAVALVLASAAGCAHGGASNQQRRDLRGGARVGSQARAIVVGSAALVHATGDKPVRWFVADRVSGDDRDCANPASRIVLAESMTAAVTVASGQVLCAAVGSGATDVNWHQFSEANNNMWALR
jgi:hypothetical protein